MYVSTQSYEYHVYIIFVEDICQWRKILAYGDQHSEAEEQTGLIFARWHVCAAEKRMFFLHSRSQSKWQMNRLRLIDFMLF